MVSFDNSLVADFSPETPSSDVQAGVVAKFSEGAKQLHYIAASHTNRTYNAEGEIIEFGENPTLAIIDAEVASFKPDFIIIEAFGCGLNRPLSGGDKIAIEGIEMHDFSEEFRAEHHAKTLNIPYAGGEPNDAIVIEQMRQRGYSTHDIMGLYGFRQITALTQNGKTPISEAVLEKEITHYFATHRNFESIPNEERISYAEFTQWFEQRNTEPQLNLTSVNLDDTCPTRNEDATYFQRGMADIGDVREAHINHTIDQAFANHDRVLVVYGSTHLQKSLPVYRAALGEPEFDRPDTAPDKMADEKTQKLATIQSLVKQGALFYLEPVAGMVPHLLANETAKDALDDMGITYETFSNVNENPNYPGAMLVIDRESLRQQLGYDRGDNRLDEALSGAGVQRSRTFGQKVNFPGLNDTLKSEGKVAASTPRR